jgi:hypothetical protein
VMNWQSYEPVATAGRSTATDVEFEQFMSLPRDARPRPFRRRCRERGSGSGAGACGTLTR